MSSNLRIEKTVAITTLGCKVNQYESAALEELFRRRDYGIVDFNESADVYVINTCTVTSIGDRKSRQLIRRAVRTNPKAVVAVTGCYAQTAPDEVLAVQGVDLVLGAGHKAQIVDLIEETSIKKQINGQQIKAVTPLNTCREFEELPGETNQGRARAYIKIQEGCENYCAYCIVPYARGILRSRAPEKVLAGVSSLVENGFKEIVLTGIHIGAYGREKKDGYSLVQLLESLKDVPGLLRLRLSSLEPNDISSDLLDLMASGPPFCRHLHIPLQSGDDAILKKMRRLYDTDYFRRLLDKVRNKLPEVGITTDIMVGFPGEDEQSFLRTREFVQEMNFSALHVFKFSPRRGTPAAGFANQVEPREKEVRSRELINLGKKTARSFAEQYLQQTVWVLAEHSANPKDAAIKIPSGLYEGLTDNYLRVFFPDKDTWSGQMVQIKIEELSDASLLGRII